ncbi:MAG: cyclodeaminase [Candidatus Aminicenantes bacterium]|nr:cyclodeaminase [Candidatus Aminicenantes bacterium]
MEVKILKEKEIRECVGMNQEAVDAVALGFTRLAEGKVSLPPIIRVDVESNRGEVDVKTAYIDGLDSFAIKVASGFLDNPAAGLPYGSGMMVVISAKTGFLEAVLLDNGFLTDLRTGIAGAIAAKHLAPSRMETAGVIGSGMQARYQIRGLRLMRPFHRLLVYGIDPEGVDRYITEMTLELGVEVIKASGPEEVVRQSGFVVTTTPSREPYLRAEWLHPGLHITAMGADGEHKQELFPEVMGRADRLACDSKTQCFRLGEFHHALKAGVIGPDTDITELGDLTGGRKTGRKADAEITVCDLTGVGVQDTTIAVLALQKALARGLGTSLTV